MARDYQINGETLVSVWGGAHNNRSGSISSGAELGLAVDKVIITPRFFHQDFRVDDFGPHVGPEVQFLLAEVNISMTLVHYDNDILQDCISEAMAGSTADLNTCRLMPAGTLMGNGIPIHLSGNHFISVDLESPVLDYPWRFFASYITDHFPIPLGTSRSLVELNWRVIPYVPLVSVSSGNSDGTVTTTYNEIQSSGAPLWEHLGIEA